MVKLANYTRQGGAQTFCVIGFQLHCELSEYIVDNHAEAKTIKQLQRIAQIKTVVLQVLKLLQIFIAEMFG